MLPGKKYTPEDYLRVAWARKWFILVPAVTISSAVFVFVYFMPNLYRSSSTVLVTPQRVPEKFVQSTVTADVTERLHTISQQIMSRTRLEAIIAEFDLYRDERKTMIMEDVVERMRTRDIGINVATPRRRDQDSSSFTVSYTAPDPRLAMRVAERLASMFVKENMAERESLADSTNQFLQSELEDKKRRLLEYEQKLRDFRAKNYGRLPSQAQSNLQLFQATQSQLQAEGETATRERERLQSIESQLADLTNSAIEVIPSGPAGSTDPSLPAQIEAARAVLSNLRLTRTDEHPEVRRQARALAELESRAEEQAANAPISLDGATPVKVLPPAAATRVTQLRTEGQEIRLRLDNRSRTIARLQSQLAGYSGRIEAAPMLESELTDLMRDYTTLQEQYDALLRKSEESKLAVNVERRQIGEQFRVLEGARLPEKPISPDRLRFNMFGLLGGLGIGLALAALLEYRDTTLKTDDDVIMSLALPVLAVIPAMTNDKERTTQRRRKRMALVAASATSIVLVVAAVAWKYRLIQDLVR